MYLPLDVLAAHGVEVSDLGKDAATPQLRAALRDLVARTEILLMRSAGFARAIRDRRLAVEVAIIHRLASDLTRRLKTHDPLSQRVHHGKAEMLGLATLAAAAQLVKGRG